jgi:PAS domain S-box-containing protein
MSVAPDFRLLFESAPDLFLVLAPDAPCFTIIGASDAYLKQAHIDRSQVLGRSFSELNGEPNLLASLERIVKTGEVEDLPYKYLGSVNVPIFDDHGKLRYIIHKIEGEADNESPQTDHEIQVLYEKLKIQDKLKTQFLANVSHEFRTPISLILSPIEQLLREELSSETRRRLEVAQRNARVLLNHVNDLLDIAKLEAGKFTPQYTEIDLSKLILHIAGHFERFAHQRGIAYRLEVPDSIVGQVDVSKFRKILTKLLSNAIKFTPDGGKVRCTVKPSEDRLRLEVADSGPGIAKKYHKDIFERFFQIEDGSVRRFGGIGLGLPIVRDLLERLGGTIDVETAPEGGALLKIDLPLVAPARSFVSTAEACDYSVKTQSPEFDSTDPSEDDRKNLENERPLILIVEDNPDMNSLIRDMLAPYYRTASALNGRVGLAKALELHPDLILSDVMMPEMSGDQLFQEIKSRAELKDTPFIILTAKADDELRVKLLRAGTDDYLTKPFLCDELVARIRNLLAVRKSSEKLRIELEARKRAEKDLKESEEKFRGILSSAYSGVLIVNDQGIIEFVNDRMCMFGYEPQELLGQHINILLPDSALTLTKATSEGMEIKGLKKDGSGIYVAVSLWPYRHKNRQIVAAFFRDLSEERRIATQEGFLLETGQWQAETMDYQERLQRTTDAIVPKIADISVIYVEENGKIVPKAISHFRKEDLDFAWRVAQMRPALVSATSGPMYVMRTGKSQLIEDMTQEVLEEMGFGFDPADLARIKELKVRSYMAVPLNARGRIIGILTLVKLEPNRFTKKDLDFAEVIAARSALQIENARLYHEAQSSIRLREEILGIVSHDLKNPLSSVVMSNQLLEDARQEMSPDDAALIHRPIEIIDRSTKQMDRLIEDLLDFARIESGTLSLKLALVSAEKLVRDGIELVRHHSDRKRIKIEVTGPPRSPLVSCDPQRITQVFYNLLGNAVKFSPSDSTITVKMAANDSNLMIEIQDQGPGIPKENLETIFRKYWKVKTNTKDGAGLGLYIARKIVESHGGKLHADSVEGQGSLFTMTLPLESH